MCACWLGTPVRGATGRRNIRSAMVFLFVKSRFALPDGRGKRGISGRKRHGV